MLILGAAALTAQIMAAPPAPFARCEHFLFDHLQGQQQPHFKGTTIA